MIVAFLYCTTERALYHVAMNTSQIFSITSTFAALQWLVLIVFPHWQVTRWLIRYPIVPIILSIVYCSFIGGFFTIKGGGYNSLEEVRTLFASDGLLLAGWVHYLAFDLLIGFAIMRSAKEKSVSHWLVIPCLILTFVFGPCGFLLYQMIQTVKNGSVGNQQF
jgi:glucan phosphoethanolaminetransferase (alkaline phosphatase superfamily)